MICIMAFAGWLDPPHSAGTSRNPLIYVFLVEICENKPGILQFDVQLSFIDVHYEYCKSVIDIDDR